MSVSATSFIPAYKSRIDSHLETVLTFPDSHSSSLFDAIRYSVLNGGKRIRPVLTYAAATAVGEINLATDASAAAVELIHAYSLIHDDLPAMDDDDLRRGMPTCHIAFDEATAILAGDALQTLAFEELLTVAAHSPQLCVQLLSLLCGGAGASGMVVGQALDIAAVNLSPDLQQLEQIHCNKTGAMINASILMGAVSAGADSQQQAALSEYGDAIGLAFQVQDDILDVTGTTEVIGKRQGADEALNKPTYVTLLGLGGAREKAADLHQKALAALRTFDSRADQLRAIADYIVNRNS